MKHNQVRHSKPLTLKALQDQFSVNDSEAKFLFPNLYKKNGQSSISQTGHPYWPKPATPRPYTWPKLEPEPVFKKFETGLESIFLISDTHFGDGKLIRLGLRPFATKAEMDLHMTEEWNTAVSPGTLVFIVGDFRSKTSVPLLNGEIALVAGNHDIVSSAVYHQPVEFAGQRFVLSHRPYRNQLPYPWGGWLIHGHVHDQQVDIYPFINGREKTINVSAELLNYRPISVRYLLSLELESIYYMKNVDSEPTRW